MSTNLTLKLMINTKTSKVIFAEADSEFVDVLLSFLTLPLGTIIRRMNKHFGRDTKVLGCFNNLYSSVEKLSDSNFVLKEDRQLLLNPKNALQTKNLKLKVDDSEHTPFYTCSYSSCTNTSQIAIVPNACGSCGCRMMIPTIYISPRLKPRVFTNVKKSFIITDDLRLMPSIDGLNFEVVQDFASDLDECEEKTISLGLNGIMNLLKWSLLSTAPLTNLFRFVVNSGIVGQPIVRTWAPKHDMAGLSGECGKIVIKALLQKSTNKLLFFWVGVDFVDFLFKLLTIPLGGAVLLSGGNSGLGSIDNLYTSVSNLSKEYLVSSRDLLINPKAVLLHERSYFSDLIYYRLVSLNEKSGTPGLNLLDLLCDQQIIEKPSTFIVTDDLIVTPTATVPIISHLKSSKVPVSDVKELPINIGAKEALDIFMASLVSSTSVLSNALQLTKQPKQEK